MKQRKVSLTKTKWLAALLLVAVFSAGIATGMVFSTLTRAKRQRDFRPPPDHLPHRGLNLTADQEKKARE
ncbi:hypothetical protein KKF84_08740, partial [Myxococcota bacterium]|nr:hypothetical protein [Myxococcota bacterium]MBU1535395.1 hypothetical protein [Myxococcota bacterium]